MASTQPSFLHFYLFRTRQHNTSFLLTSKDELKHPGVVFPKQPNLLLSFTIVNEGNSFIPLFGQQYFSLKNNPKPSPQIFRHINEIVKILHLYSLSPIPFQIYSLINLSINFIWTRIKNKRFKCLNLLKCTFRFVHLAVFFIGTIFEYFKKIIF